MTQIKKNGKNEDFTPLAERTVHGMEDDSGGVYGHDASTEAHNFWTNIADYAPGLLHTALKELMTDKDKGLPHICKLLYNCLLFDFKCRYNKRCYICWK